jgi:hypothetical protein
VRSTDIEIKVQMRRKFPLKNFLFQFVHLEGMRLCERLQLRVIKLLKKGTEDKIHECGCTVYSALDLLKLETAQLRKIAQRYSAGLRLDDRGFESQQGLGNVIFTTASKPALGPTQSPIQWVPGALSLGVRRPERLADHSAPSSAEMMNA